MTHSDRPVPTCRSCVNGHHSSRTPCRLTAPGGVPCECGICPGVAVATLSPMAQALRYWYTEAERKTLRADLVAALRDYAATDVASWRKLIVALDEAAAADVAPIAAELVAGVVGADGAAR